MRIDKKISGKQSATKELSSTLTKTSSLEDMPDETILNIFRFFKSYELGRLASVSKKIKCISEDNVLWMDDVRVKNLMAETGLSAKELYAKYRIFLNPNGNYRNKLLNNELSLTSIINNLEKIQPHYKANEFAIMLTRSSFGDYSEGVLKPLKFDSHRHYLDHLSIEIGGVKHICHDITNYFAAYGATFHFPTNEILHSYLMNTTCIIIFTDNEEEANKAYQYIRSIYTSSKDTTRSLIYLATRKKDFNLAAIYFDVLEVISFDMFSSERTACLFWDLLKNKMNMINTLIPEIKPQKSNNSCLTM